MLDTGREPTALAALVLWALLTWMLYLGPGNALHRAFALFLFTQAGLYTILSFDDAGVTTWGKLAPYFVIGGPFAAVNFAFVFHQRYGRPRHWLRGNAARAFRVALLLTAIAVEGLFLLRHDLYFEDGRIGPLYHFIPLTYASYALIGLSAATAYLHAPRVTTRSALYLFALAFALEPAFRALHHTLSVLTWSDLGAPAQVTRLALYLLTFLLVLSIGAVLGADAMGREHVGDLRAERRFLLAISIAFLTGGVTYTLYQLVDGGIANRTLLGVDALWHIVLVIVAAYAVLRYQLFDADVKFRFVVKQSTFAAMVGLIFVVASESIERVVNVADTTIAVGVAVGIALLFRWLQQISGMVARKVMPNVIEKPEDIVVRKEEIYRATVEGILIDGVVTAKERAILTTLARKLHLHAEEAARIEREFRLSSAQMGSAVPSASKPGDA